MTTLFELAGNFASMAQDIFDLCEEVGTGIKGQILLTSDNGPLSSSSLDSGWAFKGSFLYESEAQEQAQAITSRLNGIAESLQPDNFLKTLYEMEETSLGRSLRESSDPRNQVLRDVLQDSCERTIRKDAFSEADRSGILAALDAISNARAYLSSVPLPPGVKATIEIIESRCSDIINKMERTRRVREPQHPLISRLGDEIQFACNRLRNLAKDTAEAERVEGGFANFMRSDFWFQRWRIYELWIFVKVIRILQRLGGKIKFSRVNKGVWQLKYGRDIDPVALCELGRRNLDLYYQIYEPGEDHGSMPDIAVREKEGRVLFVIDPKHGKSYNFKKVEDILMRYSNQFHADLTAVVNYYPMRSYPFNLDWLQERLLILASGVAPNSIAYRRLELNLEDTSLTRGISLSAPVAERPKITPLEKQASCGELLYIARQAVEVDEPAGPWLMSKKKGTIYLSQLKSFFNEKVESIDTSHDGAGCMVKTEDEWILFCPNQKPKKFDKNEIGFSIGWHPQGTLYAAVTENIIKLWKRHKNDNFSLELPENLRFSNYSYSCIGWETSGESFIFELKEDYRTPSKLFRIDLSGNLTSLELNGLSLYKQNITGRFQRILTLGSSHETLFRSNNLGNILINKSDIKTWPNTPIPIGVSPGGRYRIFEGPSSFRRKEDVNMLVVEEWNGNINKLPLIRFYGRISTPIKWSPDESRFAFFVYRKGAVSKNRKILFFARPGDRYAESVSISGQDPGAFDWVSPDLLKTFEKFSQ